MLAGCQTVNSTEEIQPQGEGTAGPIPIQVEATEIPPTAVPTEGAVAAPTDTPSSSGDGYPTDTPVVVPPTTAPVIDETVEIQLDWDIYSVEIGESETLNVQALSSSGDSVPFSIQTDGNCLSAAFDLESITITAGDELCEQVIIVKAANAENKTLKVIVFDPMVLDIGEGLLIRYVNEYDLIANSRDKNLYDSGNKLQFGFLHPKVDSEEGWYPLGSTFAPAPWKEDFPYVASIVVKDSKNADLLRAPADYELLDDTYGWGTGMFPGDAYIWKAICDDSFVPLGVIATENKQKPGFDAMRCVHEDYTRPGEEGHPHIWDTAGDNNVPDSGYDWVLTFIDIPDYPNPEVEKGYALLQTGTSMFCQMIVNWNEPFKCDFTSANLLVVPLPVYKHATHDREPVLISSDPYESSSPRFFSAVRVPFTMIPRMSPVCDPWKWDSDDRKDCQMVKNNIERSPFIYLIRGEDYESIWTLNNTQSTPVEKEVEYGLGYEESVSETTTQSIGIDITIGGEVSLLGSGGSWSVSMSYQFEWSQTLSRSATSYSSETTTVTCSPQKKCQLLQVWNVIRFTHMDGSGVDGIDDIVMQTPSMMTVEYPPPD
jgi:hypothetical protein